MKKDKCNLTQKIIDDINKEVQKLHKIPNNDPNSLQKTVNDIKNIIGDYCPELTSDIRIFRDNINVDNPERTHEFDQSKDEFIEMLEERITIL